MKILLISGSRIVGGAERATLQLARSLAERGHAVDAMCPGAGEMLAALRKSDLPVYPGAIGGSLNVLTPLMIARVVWARHPDVLIATTSDEWVWSCLIPRPARRPALVLVRHMALALAYRVRWLAGRRADAIVAVSRGVRASLLADSAIAPPMVHVIRNAVRFAVRQDVPSIADRVRARASLGLPQAGRWIGFLGGINLGKGIADVMAAARHASQSLGDVGLLVCGRKDTRRETPDCDELARTYGLHGRVHYLGHIEDVRSAITAVDMVAIATRSSLKEGLAQTAIDAMACGTPIAAYALEGVTEVVGEDEPAAILARPDDVESLAQAVTRMLADSELAARIARVGLVRARTAFDPNETADRYEMLLTALLKERGQSGSDAS
jgi:glycosyltransferase involved in cell wall biosynthesis